MTTQRTCIAGWEVLGRLARGSTAEVLVARPDLSGESTPAALALGLVAHTDERVVLKRLYPHLAENEDFVRMFVDEVRLMSLLRHEGIVAVLDLDEDDETFFAVLELVDGPSLSAALRLKRGPLDVAVAAAIGAKVAAALDLVHTARDPENSEPLQLVHRDVNPQNILVGRDGAVKLADFGVARSAPGRKSGILAARDTNAGVLKGKASYLAPEQVLGHDVDQRADLFALGTTLYQLVTGRLPFTGDSDVALLGAIAHQQPEPPQTASASLNALVLALLEKDPRNRPATAAAVGAQLAEDGGGDAEAVARFVCSLGLPSLRA